MRVRNLLILLVTVIFTVGLGYVVFVGVKSGPYTFKPVAGLVSSVELNGGTMVTLKVSEPDSEDENSPVSDELVEKSMEMFRERLDARGFYDIYMTREGADLIRIEMYTDDYEDLSTSSDLTTYICEKGVIKFFDEEGNLIAGNEVIKEDSAREIKYDDTTYMLFFLLTDEGVEKFDEVAREYGSDTLIKIEYDGTNMTSKELNGIKKEDQFAVALGLTRRETKNMAYQLNSGILPAKFNVRQARSLMPTMGETAFHWLIVSAIVAVAIGAVVLIIKNRLLGILSDIVYILFGICFIFALAAVRLKLSPAGIAGVVIGTFVFYTLLYMIVSQVYANANAENYKEIIKLTYRKYAVMAVDIYAVMLIFGIVMAMFEKSPMAEFSSAVALSGAVGIVFIEGILRGLLHVFYGAFPNMAKKAVKEEVA